MLQHAPICAPATTPTYFNERVKVSKFYGRNILEHVRASDENEPLFTYLYYYVCKKNSSQSTFSYWHIKAIIFFQNCNLFDILKSSIRFLSIKF